MSHAARSTTAVVNVDVEGPRVSRHLYGHFAEHLGRCIYDGIYVGPDSSIPNVDGIRSDIVAALRELNIPNLRWPGGCFADEYHWRDGIGPKESRPTMVNTHWGNVVENNHFGTHEFMRLCELLGTEPYITGNVGSGTVREMSDWIEYLTRSGDSPMSRLRRENGRDEPWRVRFWGIGNETWGCGGNMRAEYYADLARQYATYCRNHDDNELYRIAVGARDGDVEWTQKLMESISCLGCDREPRRSFQALAFHYYTKDRPNMGKATSFDEEEYLRTITLAGRMDEIITGHSRVMDCYDPRNRIGLVCDEWGTWWEVEEGTNPGFLYQQNTMRDALVASLTFDIFHRHAERLVMANIAQTVNVLQAMLLTDGDQLVRTPTFHVFEMNRGHQDATLLPIQVKTSATLADADGGELAAISASATRRDRSMLVSATNVDPAEPAQLELDVRGGEWQVGTARILTAPALADHNTASDPATVEPREFDGVQRRGETLVVDLPAHSFVTVSLDLG